MWFSPQPLLIAVRFMLSFMKVMVEGEIAGKCHGRNVVRFSIMSDSLYGG